MKRNSDHVNKELLRTRILSLGADVCGFADMERFVNAPDGFSPIDIFPPCRSVIVMGVALPKGLYHVPSRLVYGYYNSACAPKADDVAFAASKLLEDEYDCLCVPIPGDGPYEFWNPETAEGRGLISVKHAAVLAGLGSLGKSTLFLNKRYGNRLGLSALLTDLVILPDAIEPSLCLPGCHKCIDACPSHALSDHGVNQKLCRAYTYGKTYRGFDTVDCNACRTVCPLCDGKSCELRRDEP